MHQTLTIGLAAGLLTAFPAMAGEKTVTLAVENMTCVTCPYIVKQALAKVQGMIRVEVSFENKTAAVTFDDTQADLADITAATADVGFPSHPSEGLTPDE
jgi:mercuric ion binding protein